jgi:hypothetical protein
LARLNFGNACCGGVAHHRFGCINNAKTAIDQWKKGSVLFAGANDCSPAQADIEAGPDVEGAAPKSHIAAISDSAEVRTFKPPMRFAINKEFGPTPIAATQHVPGLSVGALC